jgi:Immunity protein 27
MSSKILPGETEIVGGWLVDGGQVKADQLALRIDDLVNHYLVELAASDEGWSVLYMDPGDGRHWELTYPDSPSHGGGAPRLAVISSEEARVRYKS